MKERPILFSGPMVRAILSGKKTQTRRVVKLDRYGCVCRDGRGLKIGDAGPVWRPYGGSPEVPTPQSVVDEFCPYGKPGDRLYVRETWQHADWTEDGYPYIRYAADNAVRLIETIPGDAASEALSDRWADLSAEENYAIDGKAADRRWRPSIHMPRWASRIDLLVKDVRVERLQEISEEDALAEGIWSRLDAVPGHPENHGGGFGTAKACFECLWDSINVAKHPWSSNPWVWVVEFERVAP